MYDLCVGLPVSVTVIEDIRIVPVLCADSTHRRRSWAAGWRTVVTTIRGRIRLCPLCSSDSLSACAFRSVCRYRCFCAGTGSSDRWIPGDRFLSRDVTGFPRSFRLGGRLFSFSCRFRCPESVLSRLGSCSVAAEAVGRFLRIFHPAVIRRAVVGVSFLSCRRGYVPESCVWGHPESVSICICEQRSRSGCETGLKMGAGRQYFRWR